MSKPSKNNYQLARLLPPHRTEGPKGYLCRLGEANLLSTANISSMGITYHYDSLVYQQLMPDIRVDPELHKFVHRISEIKLNQTLVLNEKYARYCPICLSENGEWRVEWELYFYDACHMHKVWLVDQCSSCGKKIDWNRSLLKRCNCGADFSFESPTHAPKSLVMISTQLSQKILFGQSGGTFSTPFEKPDISQCQTLIRYLGNYMNEASGRNPLKMKDAGDLVNSWPTTTLAAEIVNDWPNALHHSLSAVDKSKRGEGFPSLKDVFGAMYEYVYKGLKDAAFDEVRVQFEWWICHEWRGGVAKRNKRIVNTMLENAVWIPSTVACDYLGISVQRLKLYIREGTIVGETSISETGRSFTMVRRDNLAEVKAQIFGTIDMTKVQQLLGIQKRRMRQLITLLFKNVKKLGAHPGARWEVSRQEVNQILELNAGVRSVSIEEEGSVSLKHVMQFWSWTSQDIAAFIHAIKVGELRIELLLDSETGIAAWCFSREILSNWKLKSDQGVSNWMTITQAAKLLGTKEQVAYELVKFDLLKAEVMPFQRKRGTRVKRKDIDDFNEKYIFSTKIGEQLGVSSLKVISNLKRLEIEPISGPKINGARQILYLRADVEKALNLN